jgi:hypothetical protein
MIMDTKSAAASAEQVVEGVMKVEPVVATIASMFVPDAAPIVAVVQPAVLLAAPFVENALKALADGNGGDAMGAFIQLLQHLTPGHPNAAGLGEVTDAGPSRPSSEDPSAQGSG